MFALLIGLPRRWSIGVVGSWVFCTIVSFVLGITSPGTYTSLLGDRYLLGFVLSPFNIEFLLGAIAAHLLLKRSTNRGPAILAVGISLFAIASLNVSYSWFEFNFSIANRIIFFGVPSFLIVWGAVNTETQWKLAAPKISQLMGDSSYSIYLTHFPVLVAVLIAAKKFGWAPGITGLLAVATCVLFGIFVYSTIERPLLQFCRRLIPDPAC